MSDHLSTFVADFNRTVESVENLLSIARAGELQREAVVTLEATQSSVGGAKAAAAAAGEEDYANLLLGCECVAAALMAELRMWLLLKEEKPDEAWNELVNAQMSSMDAVRAHKVFAHLEQHVQKLEAIEKIVFPPQVFVSSGMIVGHQECSICESDYDDCDHLIGIPYMGRFCYIIARDISLDHVAIVKEPADKHCRVERFNVDGVVRNRMTWRIERSGDVG
ncbi:MAG TPA: hypothetical protein PKC80_02325 [Burkholderiaceae bacterium]|nr:hypothetical protein [Burkholderiaceae bacterium]